MKQNKDCSTPEAIALAALTLSVLALAMIVSVVYTLSIEHPIVKFTSDFLK